MRKGKTERNRIDKFPRWVQQGKRWGQKKREKRLEIEIYDIENDYDGDGARSLYALPSLVAVNLAMRADQTKIGC